MTANGTAIYSGKAGRFGNGISTRSLGKPSSMFPGQIATDSYLTIAVDRQQTSLALAMGSGDTSMTVVNASAIAAFNLLSIDNEIVKTTGAPAGNVVPISRGFDGTTPAAHQTSATVSGLIDAWHHNALVAEIEAIENALGPNLSRLPSSPFLISTLFIFSPQTPGGTLSAGAQVITLTPVPQGVNGTDQNHYLYISGGTGTAEAVPIIGGSAVAGAASGTVIVTCANAHSGAWTIQSATAGIQEALDSMASPQVFVPAGNYNIYATITVPNRASIIGFSMSSDSNGGATMLLYQYRTGVAVDLYGDQTTLRNIHIRQVVDYTAQTFNATAGNIGVRCWNVSPRTATAACLDNVNVEAFYQAFSFDSNSNLWFTNLIGTGSTQDNFTFAGCNGHGRSILTQSAKGNGITCKQGSNSQILAPILDTVEIYNNTGWGLYWQAGGQWSNVTSQANGQGDYYFQAQSQSTFNTITSDSAGAAVNGYTNAPLTNPTAPGVYFASGAANMNISGITVLNPRGNAVHIAGAGNLLASVLIINPNVGANADDNKYGLLISGAGFNVVNSLAGDQYTAMKIGGANAYFNSVYGLNLGNSHLAFPLVELANGAIQTLLTGMVIPSSGTAVQTDAGSSLIFSPQLYTYTAANSFAAGTLIPSNIAPAITNGGTLTVTANAITITGQVSEVGAGLIKNITLANGASCSSGYLVASGAFTTDQTGNINSAPLTAVTGTLYIWVLDPNSGKFYIR